MMLKPKNGGSVELRVMEGEFSPTSITPIETWTEQLKKGDYVLINSVDHAEHVDNALSKAIGLGCDLTGYAIDNPNDFLTAGDMRVHPCGDPYHRLFGDGKVANSLVVTWVADKQGRTPCYALKSIQQISCFKIAIDSIIEKIFDQMDFRTASTIVWPALGTGNGGLPPGVFYDQLANGLETALTKHSGPWNTTIVLAVYHRDGQWVREREAIAAAFGRLADDWTRSGPQDDAIELAYMSGVAMVVAGILILSAFVTGKWGRLLPRDLLSSIGPVFTAIVYFSAAYGMMAIAKQAARYIGVDQIPIWTFVLFGCAAVPLCYPLQRLADGAEVAAKEFEAKRKEGDVDDEI